MTHGQIRKRPITVNNGKSKCTRTEIYCTHHGWIGFYDCGEMEGFQKNHAKCLPAEITGEEIYAGLPEAKVTPFSELSPKQKFVFNLLAETAQEVLGEFGEGVNS